MLCFLWRNWRNSLAISSLALVYRAFQNWERDLGQISHPKVTPKGYFLFRLTFHFRLFSLDWCQKIIKIPNVISKAFTTEKLKPDSVCEIIVSCWLFFRGSPNCFTSSRYTVMKFRRRAICLKVLICCVLPLIASVPAANVSELERLFSN